MTPEDLAKARLDAPLLYGQEYEARSARLPQGFTYYELACLSCGARLPLGQTKEGGVPIVFGTTFALRKYTCSVLRIRLV